MVDRKKLKARIPGWGSDLDPARRPGVPKEKAPTGGTGAHWTVPELQIPTVKIYKTVERPRLTATFGTSCPPKGLSGKLRDFAYTLGEGRTVRWITLLMADRVDEIETIVRDVLTGQAGNPIRQTGVLVELRERGTLQRFNRRKLAVAAGIGSVGLVASALFAAGESKRKAA